MTPFEEWLVRNYPKGPILSNPTWTDTVRDQIEKFMEEAYEAGWNACRDKWGGLEYSDTAND